MPRADLHYALALDTEIYEASRADPSLLDPIVRVDGSLPGPARPFTVVRNYQGPQGMYIEQFVLRSGGGKETYRSPVRRIELEGEMFEDRFAHTVRDAYLEDGDEHELTFYVNDHEVGAIPVFIEMGMGGDPGIAAEETFKKALQKGTILWLSVPQGNGRRDGAAHTQPVWFVFDSGKVYVFSGPTEQHVPNLARAEEIEIIARSKDVRSRVSRVPASVRVIPTDDPQWDEVADAGLAKRLNLPDGDRARERWREQCVLVELTPRFRTGDGRRPGPQEAPAPAATAEVAAPAAEAPAAGATPAAQEDIEVEAQVDQQVYDQLIAEGKSERVARAKAKAAYVRAEKARIRAEQEAS